MFDQVRKWLAVASAALARQARRFFIQSETSHAADAHSMLHLCGDFRRKSFEPHP